MVETHSQADSEAGCKEEETKASRKTVTQTSITVQRPLPVGSPNKAAWIISGFLTATVS